jgi:hypothetical protein
VFEFFQRVQFLQRQQGTGKESDGLVSIVAADDAFAQAVAQITKDGDRGFGTELVHFR